MDNKSTMKIEATAVWNEEKGCWEVRVVESGTGFMYPDKAWKNYERKEQYEVTECDEVVFIHALAKMNGIVADALNLDENDIKAVDNNE